jgi:hypothetical protein
MNMLDAMKHAVWRFLIYPLFPIFQPIVGALPFIKKYGPQKEPNGRQRYLLGRITPGRDVYDLIAYLATIGFKNHFIAWQDDGQIASVRKLVGYRYQYHIRIFADGEIRGHYEFAPEVFPLTHLREIGLEARKRELLAFLGDWIVPEYAGVNVPAVVYEAVD